MFPGVENQRRAFLDIIFFIPNMKEAWKAGLAH
jgi:hypothetical protein